MLWTRSILAHLARSPLDAADRAIIAALVAEPRSMGRSLARASGLSEANVSRRMSRLVDDGVVRFHASIAPAVFGLRECGLITVRTRGDPERPAQALCAMPEVGCVATLMGEPCIMAVVAATDAVELMRFIDDKVCALEGVSSCNLTSILCIHRLEGAAAPAVMPAAAALPPGRSRRGYDEVDLAILRALQQNGRATFAELSTLAGVSATAVAERFRRLMSEGSCKIIAVVDPVHLGTNIAAIVQMSVDGPVWPTARRISRLIEANTLLLLGGSHQLGVDVDCEREGQLHEIAERARRCPGVTGVSVKPFRTIMRRAFMPASAPFGAPAQHSSAKRD